MFPNGFPDDRNVNILANLSLICKAINPRSARCFQCTIPMNAQKDINGLNSDWQNTAACDTIMPITLEPYLELNMLRNIIRPKRELELLSTGSLFLLRVC